MSRTFGMPFLSSVFGDKVDFGSGPLFLVDLQKINQYVEKFEIFGCKHIIKFFRNSQLFGVN